MISKTKIKEYYLANASNYIYALISDNDIKNVFNGSNAAVIRRKREYQIAYIINSAQSSDCSYNDIIGYINTGIINEYGKAGKDVLADLCAGKNVFSKTTLQKNISTDLANDIVQSQIDSNIVSVDVDGNISNDTITMQKNNNSIVMVKTPFISIKGTIDPKTGLPAGSQWDTNKNVEVSTDGKYFINYDCETDTPIGVWEYETGKQISYYDAAKGKYIAGVTPSSDKNSRNLWCNNIDWSSIIMAIINLIGQLFSGLKKPAQMASLQTDGWYGAAYNTADTNTAGSPAVLALLCIGGYLLFKKKDKKTHSNE